MLVKFQRNGHVCPGFLFIKTHCISNILSMNNCWQNNKPVSSAGNMTEKPMFFVKCLISKTFMCIIMSFIFCNLICQMFFCHGKQRIQVFLFENNAFSGQHLDKESIKYLKVVKSEPPKSVNVDSRHLAMFCGLNAKHVRLFWAFKLHVSTFMLWYWQLTLF